jgi:hypothetical protein
MTEVTPDPIFQVVNGFIAAKHLFETLAASPITLDT